MPIEGRLVSAEGAARCLPVTPQHELFERIGGSYTLNKLFLNMDNNVIAFSRAIASGEILDVSLMAKDAGFTWPVGVTKAVHAALTHQTAGSVEDGFWALFFAASIQAKERAMVQAEASELEVSAVVGVRRGQGIVFRALMVLGVDEDKQMPCIVFDAPLGATSENS